MSLQTQIREDMLAAMKSGEKETLSLLRVVAGEFGRTMNAGKQLSDEEALKVLRKMSENATELGNQGEVDILNKYLPKMLDENTITLIINEIITMGGFSGMQDMGKVMSEIKKLPMIVLINGKLASQIVKELLSKS